MIVSGCFVLRCQHGCYCYFESFVIWLSVCRVKGGGQLDGFIKVVIYIVLDLNESTSVTNQVIIMYLQDWKLVSGQELHAYSRYNMFSLDNMLMVYDKRHKRANWISESMPSGAYKGPGHLTNRIPKFFLDSNFDLEKPSASAIWHELEEQLLTMNRYSTVDVRVGSIIQPE